jgi:hypothetical protein
MDGLHVQGVAQQEGNALAGTQVGQPVPGEDAFDADHKILAVGRHGLEERLGRRFQLAVDKDLPITVQDTDIHRPGVQIDATGKLMRLGVESPEVSSSASGCLRSASRPRWDAEEGAFYVATLVKPFL